MMKSKYIQPVSALMGTVTPLIRVLDILVLYLIVFTIFHAFNVLIGYDSPFGTLEFFISQAITMSAVQSWSLKRFSFLTMTGYLVCFYLVAYYLASIFQWPILDEHGTLLTRLTYTVLAPFLIGLMITTPILSALWSMVSELIKRRFSQR